MSSPAAHDQRDQPGGRVPVEATAIGVLLGLLTLDGALLGVVGLLFNPLYNGTVPVPLGAVLSILILPWLVRRTAEIDPRRLAAAAPLVAWMIAVGILGMTGPGGDLLLPGTWQTILLCAGGPAAGLWALRRAQASSGGTR